MQHHAIPCNAINTKSMQYFWLSLNNIKYQRWGQHWPGMRYYSDKIDIHLNLPQKPWLCNRQPKTASTLYESMNLMTLNGLIHKTEKQADRRARELPATYRRPLARLDEQYHGTLPGAAGPLVQHLQSFGELQCLVGGAFGEGSLNLHSLIQSCAEARVQHLIRLTGQQEMERYLGTIVGQYRREISTCMVRAQALCLLSRVGQISPAAGKAEKGGKAGSMGGQPPGAWMGKEGGESYPPPLNDQTHTTLNCPIVVNFHWNKCSVTVWWRSS